MRNYQVKVNIDTACVEDIHGDQLIEIEADDVLRIGEVTDRDLLDEEGEESFDPEIVQATEQEQAEWSAAFLRFTEEMKKASGAMRQAIADLEKATEHVRKVARAAWKDYEPVHVEIGNRVAAVDELRRRNADEKIRRAQEAEDAALAAEDAELGPRLLLVTRPSQRGQYGPRMDAPVIHHVDCGIAKRLSHLPDPVRIAEAFQALMEGGLLAVKRNYRYEPDRREEVHVPGAACEHCQAFVLLRSHAPETFMDWLERTEKVQRAPMPKFTYSGNKLLYKKLGLDQVSHAAPQSGWARIPDDHYRRHNCLAADEVLIGWVEKGTDGKRHVRSDPERLKSLFEILTPRGVEVRWIHDPMNSGSEKVVSSDVVAIRFMSKWKLRNMAAGS